MREVVAMIKEKICRTPVVRSRERGKLRPIKELRSHQNTVNDEHGNPLFADLPRELYLSDHYSTMGRIILKDFGLNGINLNSYFLLLEHDLKLAGAGKSRMNGKDTDNSWQTKAAIALQKNFKRGIQRQISNLKQLDLIPLHDARWVTATAGPVYFPTLAGIHIPSDLNLQLVETVAAENLDCEAAQTSRCEGGGGQGDSRKDLSDVQTFWEP